MRYYCKKVYVVKIIAFGFQRRELIKLEVWNMKTGIKLEIKRED